MSFTEQKHTIERIKIAEAYLKLDLEYNEKNLSQLKIIFTDVAEKSLSEYTLKKDIDFIIIFDKGSTKSKIIFYTGVLTTVLNYSTWRQSVINYYQDGKWLTEKVINLASQQPAIGYHIIRTEKRTGLIGRLKKIQDRINYLDENLNNLNHQETQAELDILKQDMANILSVLPQIDKDEIQGSLPLTIQNTLPNPTEDGEKHMYNLYAVKQKEIEVENE